MAFAALIKTGLATISGAFILGFLLVVLIAFFTDKHKWVRRSVFGLLGLLLLIIIALQTDLVQNWLVGIASKKISKELGVEVKVKHVSFGFFNRANLEGTLIRDKQKDTLLYAGQLKVRITDWFFTKDKADLKFIGLEDATVKMYRKDSIWNYQFLADYFGTASPRKEKKSGGIELDLKKVDLKNIHFVQDDQWRGETLEGRLGSLVLDAEKINLDRKIFVLTDVTIDKPFFSITNYDCLRPDSLRPKAIKDTGLRFNTGDMFIKVANMKITNGIFINNADKDKPLPYFDGAHLAISKLNGSFTNLLLNNDTLKVDLDLSCRERSGFELKKLKTRLKVTPQIMELAKLDLQTNKSKLGTYYAMKFDHFENDFAEYVTNVFMDARFSNSKVNSDDIAFFAPDLKTWNKEISLSGDFKGTVADFSIKDFFARMDGSYISGPIAMKGLPDIDKTRISFNNGVLQTNYSDLTALIPAIKGIKSPNLAVLGNFIFRGSYNGLVKDFRAKGNISTNLGSFSTDLAMKFPSRAEPSYNGTLNTTRFNLGKFINSSKLGIVDFNGKISGSSFLLEKMQMNLDGSIRQLEFNGYNYKNIITKGSIKKEYFTGELSVNDENLDFTSTVEIDLSKEQPRFNMFGDFVKSNLKNLNLTKDNLQLTGALDANFTGTNIDNFSGEAKLLNANIKNDDVDIKFDSLNLVSGYLNDAKYLRLATNDFSANINGEFNIMDLPKSFQSFLHRYYPAYINEPSSVPKNQQFSVNITTGLVDPYLKLIDKKLSGLNDAKISGTVDTKNNLFSFAAQLPYVKYDNYSLTGVDMNGNGNFDSLRLNTEIASVQLSDSFYLPTTKIGIVSANDHSVVSINTKANNTLNDADLFADVYTLEDGVRVQFRPSAFVLNDKKWTIEKNGELVLRKSFVDAQNLKFVQGFQEISVSTEMGGEDVNTRNLNVNLKNLVIGDFTSLLHLNDPKFEGLATGNVKLKDFFGDFSAEAKLKAEQFRLDEDSLGLVNITANYDSKTGLIDYDIVSPNEKYNFTAKGSYKTKDTLSDSPMSNEIKLNNTRLTIIQKYLNGIFSNVDGYGSGNLNIGGKPSSLNLLGTVKVKDVRLKVDYTQVTYKIDSASLKFEEDGINFGQFQIKDTLHENDKTNKAIANTGTVKGKLFEKGFKNMAFDFELSTNKLLLIDTRFKDNQQFYGKAIGKANLSLKGPEDNAKMVIVAEANDTSHIILPNSTSRQSADADFIVYRQIGTEMDGTKSSKNFDLSVDLDLTANKLVSIDVVLDDLTGDMIKANGNGRLRIKAGTNEKLDIRGRYNIESGDYAFNFQSFIRRPFKMLSSSNNYIEWTGDAMKADINIDAIYEVKNVGLGDLINNTSLLSTRTTANSSLRTQRETVYVIAELREKLEDPKIRFRIDFPANSVAKNNADFQQFLTRIAQDENEMLTQATSLIVFSSFTPYGQNLGSNIGSLASSTISQSFSNIINQQVSKILYSWFKIKNIQVDVNGVIYSSNFLGDGLNTVNNNRLDRFKGNLRVGKSLFNDNIIVSVGTDFDVSVGASALQNGNQQWLPDWNVEFVLSKDRKLRAIVFSKNSLDINGSVLGRRNRQGIGISYSKDFETLFGPSVTPQKPPTLPKPPDSTMNNLRLPLIVH